MRHIVKFLYGYVLESGVLTLIKSYLFVCIDSFIYSLQFLLSSKGNYDVAVVRLDHIGDFVLWLDSAKQLSEYHNGKSVLLITSNINKDYADSLDYWTSVVGVDVVLFSTSISYRAKIILQIRRFKASTVIHPVTSRKFYSGDSIVRAFRADRKVGSESDFTNMRPSQKKISDSWYTELVDNPDYLVHELERNSHFLKLIGVGDGVPRVASLPIQPLSGKLALGQPYCVIFPGASWSGRQWPAQEFSQVANFAFKQYGLKVVLCGSENDWLLCEEIKKNTDSHQVYNLAGFTKIQDLVEIIRQSKFLISNETSAVHIAAAVGKRSICIAGGGHWRRFVPYPDIIPISKKPLVVNVMMSCYQCNWSCIHSVKPGDAVPCVEGVTVNQVVTAVSSLLDD